jgi:alkanesulfonate monooxygenase SsuD/methylene tetrahydromethanopterin reductase-like flavin-dependent oxidoreductase (luciferase family)
VGDHGLTLRFGLSLVPEASGHPELLRVAGLADELGLDLLGLQDHPYQARFLETWTLLTAIAMRTRRLAVFPDVINMRLRQPAVLAKAAATLDLLSGGRVELGLGAGGFPEGVAALGGPARRTGEAIDDLAEAIEVIRAMWSGRRGVRTDGRRHRLAGASTGPVPAHPIGIWLGAYRPRMLALTGRLADGWIPSLFRLPPDRLASAGRLIDEAARAAGRDPASLRRLYNVAGRITGGASTGLLQGPVEHWVEVLTGLTLDQGMDSYVFWPGAEDVDGQLRLFALEVAPRVREAVDRARASTK